MKLNHYCDHILHEIFELARFLITASWVWDQLDSFMPLPTQRTLPIRPKKTIALKLEPANTDLVIAILTYSATQGDSTERIGAYLGKCSILYFHF